MVASRSTPPEGDISVGRNVFVKQNARRGKSVESHSLDLRLRKWAAQQCAAADRLFAGARRRLSLSVRPSVLG